MRDSIKTLVQYLYRELDIIASRRLYLVVLIAIPLFTILFLTTIFGKGAIENVPIGVVDYSNSRLSEEIRDELAASSTLSLDNNHIFTSEFEAIKAMQRMEIFGFLVIPDGYDKKLYSGIKPELTYFYHKSLLAIGEEVNGAFLTVLANVASSYLEESGMNGGLGSKSLKAVAMPLEINATPIYNSNLNFSVYITYPFILIFLQILLIILTVYTIGSDSHFKNIRNSILCSVKRAVPALAGKLLPYFIIFSTYTLAATYICFDLMGFPFSGNLYIPALSGILLIAATMAIGLAIVTFIPNLSIAISIASMYGALGATTCGITFPIDAMDKWVIVIAQLFPIRHFTHIYHNIIYLDAPFIYNLKGLAAILLFIILIPCAIGLHYKFTANKKTDTIKALSSNLSPIYGVMLIVLGGTIGYSLLYNLIYMPNTVEEVPIAVVDHSSTPISREYTSYLSATEGVQVYSYNQDYPASRQLLEEEKVRGIIYLPKDFAERINRGEEAIFILKGTTTSFLYYLTMQESAIGAMQDINNKYRSRIIEQLPVEGKLALSQAPQININGISLYNSKGGYATFLLPVVLIVALFQTMLMAIGVSRIANPSKCIRGFTLVYILISIIILGAVPLIFNLPFNGKFLPIMAFISLFLLVTAIFGTALSYTLPDKESVTLIVPFFSVGLIFLSGVSFPKEAMPHFWQLFGYLFPSTPAITGYIKLNSMGAPLSAVKNETALLIAQGVLYTIILYMLSKRVKKTSQEAL